MSHQHMIAEAGAATYHASAALMARRDTLDFTKICQTNAARGSPAWLSHLQTASSTPQLIAYGSRRSVAIATARG